MCRLSNKIQHLPFLRKQCVPRPFAICVRPETAPAYHTDCTQWRFQDLTLRGWGRGLCQRRGGVGPRPLDSISGPASGL